MSEFVNVFVLIHGMIPDREATSPFIQYDLFWQKLLEHQAGLKDLIHKRIGVQWGHELPDPGRDPRDDEKLTRAQQQVHERVSIKAVRADDDPNNIVMRGIFGGDIGIPILRRWLVQGREGIILHELGDVIYYCSKEGEAKVRAVVYEQILANLKAYLGKQVRLHLFAHSLGVTLAHDFLYGLFAPDHQPHFIDEAQGTPRARKAFAQWRDKAQRKELALGSFNAVASQLPLFIMRKQSLVDLLFDDRLLDPAVIGIVDHARIRWQLFYDVDDLLGFSTRRLYAPNGAIREVQVNAGILPNTAHTGYWNNQTVIRRTATLLVANAS